MLVFSIDFKLASLQSYDRVGLEIEQTRCLYVPWANMHNSFKNSAMDKVERTENGEMGRENKNTNNKYNSGSIFLET